MTPEQFAYWLNGFAVLHEQPPTAEQWQSIREHLALVFMKVTQTVVPGGPWPVTIPLMPEEHQTPLWSEVIC